MPGALPAAVGGRFRRRRDAGGGGLPRPLPLRGEGRRIRPPAADPEPHAAQAPDHQRRFRRRRGRGGPGGRGPRFPGPGAERLRALRRIGVHRLRPRDLHPAVEGIDGSRRQAGRRPLRPPGSPRPRPPVHRQNAPQRRRRRDRDRAPGHRTEPEHHERQRLRAPGPARRFPRRPRRRVRAGPRRRLRFAPQHGQRRRAPGGRARRCRRRATRPWPAAPSTSAGRATC